MEIFHLGLSWETMLKSGEGEYMTFATAKEEGLKPWFSQTKLVTTFDLDKFDEAMGTPSEKELRKLSRTKGSKSSKSSSKSLSTRGREEELSSSLS